MSNTAAIAYLREHCWAMDLRWVDTLSNCSLRLCPPEAVGNDEWIVQIKTGGGWAEESQVFDFQALAIAEKILRDRLDGAGPLQINHGGHTRLDGWHVLISDVTDGHAIVQIHAPTEVEALHLANQALTERKADAQTPSSTT